MLTKTILSTLSFTLLVACSSTPTTTDTCTPGNDGKCDTPQGSTKEVCTNSRTSAMDEKRPHFTPAGVRWSCRDVNGVTASGNTADDRGQEYCEYFTMIHKAGIPEVITNSEGPVFCDDVTPCETGTCDNSIFSCVTGTTVDTSDRAEVIGKNIDDRDGVTPLDPQLSTGQLEWLAQNPSQKVGECVFTSWHQDITRRPTGTATIGGFTLNSKSPGTDDPLFRMRVPVNSNGAAQTLVEDCLHAGKKSIKDGYMRGCQNCGDLGDACVAWRKSDPSVCTMAMRIAECECEINVKTTTGSMRKLNLEKSADLSIARQLFVPESRRGFTLGTWDGIQQLPTGCRYVETGDPKTVEVGGVTVTDEVAGQTLVTCDLLGSHITAQTATDPKEACRTAYGEDIVVHVRAPVAEQATLTCNTEKAGCDVPWNFDSLNP